MHMARLHLKQVKGTFHRVFALVSGCVYRLQSLYDMKCVCVILRIVFIYAADCVFYDMAF